MGILDWLNPVKELGDTVAGILDQFIESDEDKVEAQRVLLDAQRKFQQQVLAYEATRMKEASKTVRAEVASQHWLAANWRPLLMLTFTYIVLHNYVIVPIFGAPAAEIPTDMWTLMKIGVGGYVVGRSAEKIAPTVSKKFNKEAE